MIYVNLIGHDFRYEVYQLIKVFYPNEEIIFVDDLTEHCEDFLIVNRLTNIKNELESNTAIYNNGDLKSEYNEKNIDNIKIDKADIKKKVKTGIKKSIYNALKSVSDIDAPWGILTGVRPIKIVHSLLDEGISENEISKVLKNEYMLFPQKSKLMLEIAKMQRRHLYPLNGNRFSLYISIPFCPTRCLYCSFPSLNINRYVDYVDKYIDKLIYEINQVSQIMKDKTISTVYVGGGTPSAIPVKSLEMVVHSILKCFKREDIKEITVEAGRPDTINAELLRMLKEYAVDRISINPQTMNDNTLKLIGRQHNAQDIINAYLEARKFDFNVINMDLIIGLPTEGVKEIERTLKYISELDPENLTVHTLSIKKGSEFMRTINKYKLTEQSIIEEMLEETRGFMKAMGLNPYYLYRQKQIIGNFENIGYAKEGRECIYNIKMMEEKETILGLGMGAVSKIFFPETDRIERIPNVKSIWEYIDRIDEMIERKAKLF